MVPEDRGSTTEVPLLVPSQPVVITNVQVRFGTIFWITLRVVLSLFLMLFAVVALVAIVGKVISNADNVSIVKMIPTVRPAASSTSNLTAVPSVAVSKLISLRTSMSVTTRGSFLCPTTHEDLVQKLHSAS